MRMSAVFKALSDPTRLKIVLQLTSAKRLCVGAIAEKMGMTQPAISQQLKILKNAGIIAAEKVGLYVHYQINRSMIEEHERNFAGLFEEEQKKNCVTCPKKR